MPHAALTIRLLRLGLPLLLALSGVPAVAGDLTVTVMQRNDKPLVGAVVTVDAESPTMPAAQPVDAVMDQVALAFVPDVLVVPLHSRVQFPNSDIVSHQVYSFSSAKIFQLPLYRGKPYRPVVFDRPGVVTLGCNIHDKMLAYIVVTTAPFFGRTDDNGHWTGATLPAGRYRVRVWHPLLNEEAVESSLTAGSGQDIVSLRLSRNLRPAPITGQPRSWDY